MMENNLREKLFSLKKHKKILAPEELNSQLVLNIPPFASVLSYIYMCGSGMGSKKLLNTDPDPQTANDLTIWIR